MLDAAASPRDAAPRKRTFTTIGSLDDLVGAHPASLRQLYSAAEPADPDELGEAPRGRLLTIEPGSAYFLLTRPLVRLLAGPALPWKGKVFDHGGSSGQNVIFGKRACRFHTEIAPSVIDGGPTLALSYADEGFHNPWPLRHVVDELRSVGEGFAIGPVYVNVGARRKVLLWMGLQHG